MLYLEFIRIFAQNAPNSLKLMHAVRSQVRLLWRVWGQDTGSIL